MAENVLGLSEYNFERNLFKYVPICGHWTKVKVEDVSSPIERLVETYKGPRFVLLMRNQGS